MRMPDLASRAAMGHNGRMETVTIKPGCKVNLVLDVLGRRTDGYHDLSSLFWPLAEPTDTLTIAPGEPGAGLALTCSDPTLQGPSNTICKAYEAFARATGRRPDLRAHLDKAVPTGAGLGGGSADAAALLSYLAALAGPDAPAHDDMIALAATVGADVPFFLLGRPAWAGGIGERLDPAGLDLSGLFLVLVIPRVHVSTAWAFAAWDERHAGAGPGEPPDALHSLTCGPGRIKSPLCFRLRVRNGFEDVVFQAHPKLREYKEKLLRLGASGAAMSGSGASLFALFRDLETATDAADAFRRMSIPASVHAL
jgi:4-diphosphocytidyl-2-C-methyl-D-erythritol kinase